MTWIIIFFYLVGWFEVAAMYINILVRTPRPGTPKAILLIILTLLNAALWPITLTIYVAHLTARFTIKRNDI